MTDLSRAMSEVKSLPDEALTRELAQPSGMVPGYLILSELSDRKALRSSNPGPKRLSMAQEILQGMSSPPPQKMFAEGGLIGAKTNPFLTYLEGLQNPEMAGQAQQDQINAQFSGQPPLMPLQQMGNASPVPDLSQMQPQQPGQLLTPDAVGGIAKLLR